MKSLSKRLNNKVLIMLVVFLGLAMTMVLALPAQASERQIQTESQDQVTSSNEDQEDTSPTITNEENQATLEEQTSSNTGLDYKNLADGTYKIDLTMMHAGSPGQKSMSDGAIVKENTRIIVDGGQYYLQLEMKPLTIGSLTGYLGAMSYETADEKYKPAEIINYHDEKDTFMDTFKTWYKNKYPDTTDEELANLKYPKTLRFPIEKPSDKIQKNKVQVFVPVMESIGQGNGTQKALAELDWDSLKKDKIKDDPSPRVEDEIPSPRPDTRVDKSKLNAEITRSFGYDSSDYSNESWNTFNTARIKASTINGLDGVSQSVVDQATQDLKTARENLKKASKIQPVPTQNQTWSGNQTQQQNRNQTNQSQPGQTQNTQGQVQNQTQQTKKVYSVPVEMNHAYEAGKKSMGDAALISPARVEEVGGQYKYYIQTKPIQRDFGVQTFTGQLTNMILLEGGRWQTQGEGNGVRSFYLPTQQNRVKIAVWVDAMDEIAGGGPGSGEQEAYLDFDWSSAKVTEETVGQTNNQNKIQNQEAAKKQVPEQKTNEPAPEQKTNEPAPDKKTEQTVDTTTSFNDVPASHWAKEAIDYTVQKGYFKGTGDGNFAPDRGITRGEFVTVLGRMAGVDQNAYKDNKFEDVADDVYYTPYINWAQTSGLVQGSGHGNFEPDRKITREEMSVIIVGFIKDQNLDLKKGETVNFADAGQVSSWATDAVKEASSYGLIQGMGDGNFSPKTDFTRAQVAQVLYNMDHNKE